MNKNTDDAPDAASPDAIFDCTHEKAKRHFGFTLVELLLVIAITAILFGLASVGYGKVMERIDNSHAIRDILVLQMQIDSYFLEYRRYPDSLADLNGAGALLDPWGNPYEYLSMATVKGHGKVRKDRNLVPLNSDYDLYSMGKDGKSVAPLTAQASRDDIVRANNGGFIGLGADY